MIGLTEREDKLKEKLLKTGFDDWSQKEFKNLLTFIVKFGKENYEEIADNMRSKDADEVREYCEVLYSRLEDDYLDDSKKILQRIEGAEKKKRDQKIGEELVKHTYI